MARANGVREIWAAGKPVVNSWLGVPSSFSAEVMAHAGWDSLVVDMQHGMIDYQMMVTMLQAISTTEPCRWCACRGTIRRISRRRSTPAPTASSAR